VLVVTGTSTGVGKTVVTAAVAALARADGRRVAVVKPAQTGIDDGDSDAAEVARLAGLAGAAVHELAAYPEPLAPRTAAVRAGMPGPDLAATAAAVRGLAADHDLVVVEGAGGLLVEIGLDPPWTLADLAAELSAPVLVVAAAGLGTLNHTALTAEALAARSLVLAGVVVGAWPQEPALAERCNLTDLDRIAGLAGAIPAGAGQADPASFPDLARRSLAPRLGGDFDAADFTRRHAPAPFRAPRPIPNTRPKASE
jgi:dethiobiotin synthetase